MEIRSAFYYYDVYLENYDYKIKVNVKNSYWIPSYYYTLLESKNIKSDLLKYESYWKTFDNPTEGYLLTWFDFFKVQRFYFDDFYFVSFGKNVYNDIDFFAYLEEVSDTKIVYNVQKMYSHFFDYKDGTIYNQPDYLPLFEKETPYKIILIIDGDYMKMYIDEVSEKNLFQTLIRTTPEACNQIEKWIKGESDDLSKVVMPKKLSVQNESSKTTSSTNVSPNKTMTVSENLKLRSGEATSTQVLTVMSAGTKVKITGTNTYIDVELDGRTVRIAGEMIVGGFVCYKSSMKNWLVPENEPLTEEDKKEIIQKVTEKTAGSHMVITFE